MSSSGYCDRGVHKKSNISIYYVFEVGILLRMRSLPKVSTMSVSLQLPINDCCLNASTDKTIVRKQSHTFGEFYLKSSTFMNEIRSFIECGCFRQESRMRSKFKKFKFWEMIVCPFGLRNIWFKCFESYTQQNAQKYTFYKLPSRTLV